jgi:ribose/xylose/arabinose/galactoside ABC-type transport system permease subunit
MQFSRLSVGDPTVAVGLELDVIAAVVIGGASLSGGQGSILGAVIGAVFMATMANGFAQMNIAEWVQYIVKGGIIVIAVALDRLRVKAA